MYSFKNHYDNHLRRTISTSLNENEKPVQNGLSLTPSDIARMTAKGIPITTANLETMYLDGDTGTHFDISLDQLRGIDAADLFQAAESAKKRIKNAKSKMAEHMRSLSDRFMRKAEVNTPETIKTTA